MQPPLFDFYKGDREGSPLRISHSQSHGTTTHVSRLTSDVLRLTFHDSRFTSDVLRLIIWSYDPPFWSLRHSFLFTVHNRR